MSGALKLLIVMTVKTATTAQTESLCTNLYKIGGKKEHILLYREGTNPMITGLLSWRNYGSALRC
jgi:hypothetical protein